MIDMHGEGLERMLEAMDADARARAGRRRRGGQPAADPRALPGVRWRSGSTRRWTGCGPTWSPTAATSSCWGSRTAWPGCGCRAAATAAGPRVHAGAGRGAGAAARRRPTCCGMDVEGAAPLEEVTGMPLPMAVVEGGRPTAPAATATARQGRRLGRPRRGHGHHAGLAEPRWRSRASASGGQRGGRAARLPRLLRGLRLVAGVARSCVEGVLSCPACARALLPAARRAGRWTTSACSSRRCRCCATRAGGEVALSA